MLWSDEGIPAKVREALEAQRTVGHALAAAKMPDWVHLELTMGQLKALVALASTGAVNVSGLAERLELSKPTTSILVDRLVQVGYVERTEDAEDRRRTLVELTPKGSDLVAWVQQSGGKLMAHWMEQLAPDDLDALTRGLRALAAVVTREAEIRAGELAAARSSKAAKQVGCRSGKD
jgi:MarR family transcriptional regulator, organic hydroperoxide resistance regulator